MGRSLPAPRAAVAAPRRGGGETPPEAPHRSFGCATGRSVTASPQGGGGVRSAAGGRAVPSQASWHRATSAQPARTYRVRTYGCQMNVHDSERLVRAARGRRATSRADEGDDADVVVLNTCAVRENADNRLYGNLGHLRPVKDARPGMQIAVGGCLAQKDRGEIVRRAPWVDVVFGTHNVGSLPALLERARHNAEAQVEIVESLEVFPSTLPAKRDSAYSGWVSISVGCNNTCTFCIVPVAARHGEGPPARARSSPRCRRWSTRACSR